MEVGMRKRRLQYDYESEVYEKRYFIPVKKEGDEVFTAIGLYEGAGYTLKGIYRPVTECRMKINEAPGFCPVCQRALERLIKFYTEE